MAMTTATTIITIIITGTTMTDAGGTSGVYRLAVWLSPSFPVGAYTYSSGLEYAVEGGFVTDADFFRDAYRMVAEDDEDGLAAVIETADAMRGTAEIALESGAQVLDWFARMRARPSFDPAIDEYLPESLANDFRTYGAESWPEVEAVLKAA